MSLVGKEEGMLRTVLSHRLFKNASALIVLQLFNYLAPLIVLIHLTRVLGIELYGVVAFSMGMIQFSFVILDFGFSLSATQKISQHRGRRKYIGRLIGSILAIKLVLFALIAGAIVLYVFNSSKYTDHRQLFLLTLLPILGQAYQPIWFFSGLERMVLVAVVGVISRLLFVVFIISFVRSSEAYFLVPVGNGIAQISAALFSFLIISRLGFRVIKPRLEDIKYALKMTTGYFFSRLSVSAYMNSGVLILGVFSTPVATAAYSMAEQFYRVMQSFFSPVNQSLFPYMVKEKNIRLWVRITLICLLVAIGGSILGYFVSPLLIPMMFGKSWGDVLPIMEIFFVAIVIHVAAVMCGYPLAVALSKTDVANRSVLYGSIIYAVCVLLLIMLDHLEIAALASLMVAVEFYVFLYRITFLLPTVIQRSS